VIDCAFAKFGQYGSVCMRDDVLSAERFRNSAKIFEIGFELDERTLGIALRRASSSLESLT